MITVNLFHPKYGTHTLTWHLTAAAVHPGPDQRALVVHDAGTHIFPGLRRHMFHLAAAFLLHDDLRGMIVGLDCWTCRFTLLAMAGLCTCMWV